MRSIRNLVVVASLLVGAGVVSAQTCVRVEVGKPLQLETAQTKNSLLAPAGAVSLVVYAKSSGPFDASKILGRSSSSNPPSPNVAFTVDATTEGELKQRASQAGSNRANLRIMFIDGNGKGLHVGGGHPFYLASSEDAAARASACGRTVETITASQSTLEEGRPASDAACAFVAKNEKLAERNYESWILFNSAGRLCYAPEVLRQRDRLHIGQILLKGETLQEAAHAEVTSCVKPTPGPVVLSPPVPFDSLNLQSAGVVKLPYQKNELTRPVECGSDSPVVAVTVVDAQGTQQTSSHTLTLHDRYTAVVHLGVLNSKLRSSDFGLRTSGGTTSVVNKETEERGPEYTAMVVIQALPRYFQSGLSYPGRDLLHDNEAPDRVGMVLSFGIKEPAKRFGLGLSYEVTRGVNLVAVREWFKRSELDQLKVGDTFSGAESDIPLRKSWSKSWAFGLSIDLGFVTQVFGSKK